MNLNVGCTLTKYFVHCLGWRRWRCGYEWWWQGR